jgi:hypothetical protein
MSASAPTNAAARNCGAFIFMVGLSELEQEQTEGTESDWILGFLCLLLLKMGRTRMKPAFAWKLRRG